MIEAKITLSGAGLAGILKTSVHLFWSGKFTSEH